MKFTYLSILLLSCFSVSLSAQTADTAGTVFVTRDYRENANQGLVVKWIALKIYYPGGFNVYRQEQGSNDWLKLNTVPYNVSKSATSLQLARDKDLNTYLNFIHSKSYDDFQQHLSRVFVAVKAIRSPLFAELLGVIHYDDKVETGKNYRYKVTGIIGQKEEVINISKYISPGKYIPEPPPSNITVERKKTKVEINWEPEEWRYYGVYVYRASSKDPEFKKLTELPRAIQKSEGKDGKLSYPEIFFEDLSIEKGVDYRYKLAVEDYMGQLGEYSPEFSTPFKDLDAPPAPVNVKGDVRKLDVSLTWKSEPVEDLAGFNIYRSEKPEDTLTKINSTLLPVNDTSFSDRVAISGGYYYSVSAVDKAGNETYSPKIFLEVKDMVPPAPPTGVVLAADTGKIILRWNPSPEGDLWGYYIYRSLDDGEHHDNEYIIVNHEPIRTTEYIDLIHKTVRNNFLYKVVAVDTNYNRSEFSEVSVMAMPDVKPPVAPFIKNISSKGGYITIQWLTYADPDVKEYRLFRSIEGDSAGYKMVKDGLMPSAGNYQDRELLPGKKYYYYLKAVDQAGNISQSSNVYTILAPPTAVNSSASTSPLPINGIKAKYDKKKGQVKLSWKQDKNIKYDGLVIFRGEQEMELSPISGMIKDKSYTDKDPGKNKTCYYLIRCYFENGINSSSETIKVEVKDLKK